LVSLHPSLQQRSKGCLQSGDGGNAHKAKLQLGSNSKSDAEKKSN